MLYKNAVPATQAPQCPSLPSPTPCISASLTMIPPMCTGPAATASFYRLVTLPSPSTSSSTWAALAWRWTISSSCARGDHARLATLRCTTPMAWKSPLAPLAKALLPPLAWPWRHGKSAAFSIQRHRPASLPSTTTSTPLLPMVTCRRALPLRLLPWRVRKSWAT